MRDIQYVGFLLVHFFIVRDVQYVGFLLVHFFVVRDVQYVGFLVVQFFVVKDFQYVCLPLVHFFIVRDVQYLGFSSCALYCCEGCSVCRGSSCVLFCHEGHSVHRVFSCAVFVVRDVQYVGLPLVQFFIVWDVQSLGLHELKQNKPWFDDECLGFLYQQRKGAKMQYMHDPSQSNVDILNNVRREVGRHFRDKKKESLRAKIEELETNSRIQNIRDLYRGINEFKEGYQPRCNTVKDEEGDLVAEAEGV